MDYGKGIRLARTARNVSQKYLAEVTGLNASYLSLIERGSRVPSLQAIKAIAEGLNVPVYLLMLLSSEGDDLVGITPEQGATLGTQLLNLLLGSEKEAAT